MKNKGIFQTILNAIKSFFKATNGQLLMRDVTIPSEVRDYENEILGDFEMKNLKQDKINLRNDSILIKKDSRKAVNDYYLEFVNG